MSLIINNFVIKNDYVKALGLIDEFFKKIDEHLISQTLFQKNDSIYTINKAAKTAIDSSPFDTNYIYILH